MEKFIENLAQLFEAFPSATVTITYSNLAKKSRDKNESKKAQNAVKFKCTEPKLGKTIQYSTYKAKELSRLLTYFGPRGVSQKRKADEEPLEAPKEKQAKTEILGVGSIMSNFKFEEPQVEQEETTEVTPAPEVSSEKAPQPLSKNKKKKKGKKK